MHRTELWLVLAAIGVGVTAFFFSASGREFSADFVRLFMGIGTNFGVVNTSTPLWRVLLPTLLCAGTLYVVMVLNPHPGRVLRATVIVGLFALYTIYMAYRLFATLNLDTALNGTFSILFFLAELLIYVKSLSTSFQMLWQTDRTPEATRLSALVSSGRYLPDVDIFLPSYSEPPEMLRRTILGCQALRYPRKQIYLLDDQRRPAMRALAAELGCHYRDRPDNLHAKAGNMNAALPRSSGELIAIFDADFIPTQDFLERTVGFFTDPKVALVQTPQNFYSVDAVTRNLGLPGVITEEQQVFFRVAQPGRDTMGAIICHGTSFITRRAAIVEIGGFPGETLSEDWATSIKLQSAGWKTYYLNELLSAGAAAEFTSEFVTQRLRWARGTLQSFFSSTNPVVTPGLTPLQRIAHLCGPLHYIPFLSRLFCVVLPLLFFFFGVVPLRTSVELMLVFFLPYFVCQAISLSWLADGHRSAFWSEVYETMLCFPMSLTVVSTFLKPFGKPFKVSAKGETKTGLTLNRFVGIPLLVLLALYLPAVTYAVLHSQWYPSHGIFALAVAWSVYSMILIWVSLQASLDVPQPSNSIRFKHQLPGAIRSRGIALPIVTEEVSDTDVILRLDDGLVHELTSQTASTLYLSIPDCGVREVPVKLRPCDESGGHLLEFQKLPIDQHRALIAFLYCRPGQWDDRGVSEHLTFWHFIEAPFRMYPLAETR